MQLLRRLAREAQKTIFLSTHNFELALQVADRLWLMEESGKRKEESGKRKEESGKRVLHVGTPQELAQSGALARYVERPGISFNAETLTVIVKR